MYGTNEAEFIERVRKATDQHQENAVKEYRQKVSKAQRRYKELDGLVKKLYEGNATGKIPDKHFTRLLAEYDEEQTGLEAAIAQWQEAIESWNADRLKTDKFIELVSPLHRLFRIDNAHAQRVYRESGCP